MKDIKEQISELREEFNRRIDELEKELKPEFKVGQWVMVNFCGNRPRRIYAIQGDKLFLDYFDGDNQMEKGCFPIGTIVRPATPQEIESHLRSICDKYVGKKVRSLFNEHYIATIKGYWHYDFEHDRLWYHGDDYNVIVYEAGKFADILPSLKPKPVTKAQFKELLDAWHGETFTDMTMDQFLATYDIK